MYTKIGVCKITFDIRGNRFRSFVSADPYSKFVLRARRFRVVKSLDSSIMNVREMMLCHRLADKISMINRFLGGSRQLSDWIVSKNLCHNFRSKMQTLMNFQINQTLFGRDFELTIWMIDKHKPTKWPFLRQFAHPDDRVNHFGCVTLIIFLILALSLISKDFNFFQPFKKRFFFIFSSTFSTHQPN